MKDVPPLGTKCRCLCLMILILGAAAFDSCGFPGLPRHGNVSITFDEQLKPIARYECAGSFIIDGADSRSCQPDGTWSGTMPRCAVDVTLVEGDGLGRAHMDKNLESCGWLYPGISLKINVTDNGQIKEVTLISPITYKDSLEQAEWTLQVTGDTKSQRVKRETPGEFHETENLLASDQFSSVRWHVDEGVEGIIHLALKRPTYICELIIHTVPGECGHPEVPNNGQVSIEGSRAAYKCDKDFELIGDSTVSCKQGRWTGRQPICRPLQSYYHFFVGALSLSLLLLISIILTMIIRITGAMRCRQKQSSCDVTEANKSDDSQEYHKTCRQKIEYLLSVCCIEGVSRKQPANMP